jgi:hypothetical protein
MFYPLRDDAFVIDGAENPDQYHQFAVVYALILLPFYVLGMLLLGFRF